MRRRLSFFLLPLILVPAGCVARQDASTQSPFAGPAYSPPDVLVGGQSHSRVFIYQERIRGARANPIFLDGVQVASLRQRWSYFVLDLAPGEHALAGRHKENELVLQVEAGRDYYVRLNQIMAVGAGEKLTMPSCREVRTVIESGKLHPIEPADVRDQSKVSLKMPAPTCGEIEHPQ